MTIGHYAASFIAKRLHPAIPLWGLFLAAQVVDVAWSLLVLGGVEHVRVRPETWGFAALDLYHMPFTHSLIPATVGWAVVGAAAATSGPRTRHLRWAALTVAAVVASHWLLDFVVHRPDLPLVLAGPPKAGLALWDTPVIAFVLELVVFVASLAWYGAYASNHGRPPKRLIIFGIVWSVLLAGFSFGPPLPSGGLAAAALLVSTAVTVYWASKLDVDPGPGTAT